MEKVRERLRRAAAALEKANIRYTAAGGNAVAAWVSRVDEAAVQNTQDVDILLRRSDLPAAKAALAKAGFVYRHAKGLDMFLDGPTAKARDCLPSTNPKLVAAAVLQVVHTKELKRSLQPRV